MRSQMALAIFALIVGSLEWAGGTQEFIYHGIINRETYPLVAGTMGILTGGLLFAAGIALLVRSRHAYVLAQATAWISVPVFILTGIITHRAGWHMTAVGIAFPLLFLFGQKHISPAVLDKNESSSLT